MFSCDQPAGCDVSCASHYDKGTSLGEYCQLRTVTSKEGAEPCVGEAFRGEKGSSSSEKILRVFLCDEEAGLYCDRDTHRCRKTSKLGQKCFQHHECGRDAHCKDGACAAAMPPGASCKDVRCVSSAYCTDKKVCARRKAVGQPCTVGAEECVTDYCLNYKCGPRDPEPKCAL